MLNTDEKRSVRNINSMAFEEDLKRVDWNEALTLSEENPNLSFKGYLRYKTITSHNVLSEAQVKNFLFRGKVMFHSQDI